MTFLQTFGIWPSNLQKLCTDLLWICDPQDFPAKTSNKRGGFINRRILRNGNVGGLIDALPVLYLKRTSLKLTLGVWTTSEQQNLRFKRSSMWIRSYKDLRPEETVTLLLYVVVDDARHFLLPDLQSVDAHVILNVFKWAIKPIHGGSHFLQLWHQLTGLKEKQYDVVKDTWESWNTDRNQIIQQGEMKVCSLWLWGWRWGLCAERKQHVWQVLSWSRPPEAASDPPETDVFSRFPSSHDIKMCNTP